MDILTQAAITLAISLASSAFTALITVRLSLRSFYSEKWWERKADAYTALIESLYNMLNYWYEELAKYVVGSELTAIQVQALKARYDQATEQIAKAKDIGSFVITNEAVIVLAEYRTAGRKLTEEINKTIHSPADMAVKQITLTRQCLQSILKIAKRDLGISK